MKDIPPALNNDIDAIQNPSERRSVRQLTHIVYVLSGVVSILFGIILSDKKTNKGELKEQLKEAQVRSRYQDSIINIQSISLTSCLGKQITDAHQSILREQKFNEEQMRSTRRQDSLLTLLNKYR